MNLGVRGRLVLVTIPILLLVIGTATAVTVRSFQQGYLNSMQLRLEAIATPLANAAQSYLGSNNIEVLSIMIPDLRATVETNKGVANVMILDPKTGKPARIGYKVDEKGKKIRISRISGEEIKAVKPKAEKKPKPSVEPKKSTTADSKEPTAVSATPVKKAPFWKKMGFGSQAVEEQADVKEASHMQQDHTIPGQQLHSRSAGRGS